MGTRTRSALLFNAGLAAGNDLAGDTIFFVRDWLDDWLKRTAKSWSWPQLKDRVTVSVESGADEVIVGNGEGGEDRHLHRLLGNYVYWYDSARTQRGKMLVRALLDGDMHRDKGATLAANRLGAPSTCQVRVGSPTDSLYDGVFRIYPDPVPNQALIFAFDAHIIPAAIGSSSTTDTSIPWYPNDRTITQAIKCAVMEMDDGAESQQALQAELQRLEAMVIADRDFDGEGPGDNQWMTLDPSTFR